ncbi:DUF4391 domain-containing protein [Wenyingzhuangia sp. IMCC45574]
MKNAKEILNIPNESWVDKRVPKAMILREVDLSLNEKKILKEYIVEIRLLANYVFSNCHIDAYESDTERYNEIQIIAVTHTNQKHANNIVKLLQKIIPFPLVLILESENHWALSVAKKIKHKVDANKLVIESFTITKWINANDNNEVIESFKTNLDTTKFNKSNLKEFYQGFANAIVNFQSASITGVYKNKDNKAIEYDKETLLNIEELDKEITSLKSTIKKESVFSQKLDLNVKIKGLEQQKQQLIDKLHQNN